MDAKTLQDALLAKAAANASAPAQIPVAPEALVPSEVPVAVDLAQPVQQEVAAAAPEVLLPQAADMYDQGGQIGHELSKQLPDLSLPQVNIPLPQVLTDAGKGIMQGVRAIPQLFSRPQAAPAAVEPERQVAAAPVQAAITPQDLHMASEPTPEQVKAKVDQALAPVREAKAAQVAAAKVQEHQDVEQQKAAETDAAAAQHLDALDKQVRVRSLPEIMTKGSFGDKLGTIIAVALGGVAQGLLGQKSNPAIDMIDKLVEQQAMKDKLALEEKQMLRKQAFEQAELKLKELEHNTTDEYRKQQINVQYKKLAMERQATEASLQDAARKAAASAGKNSGTALTEEQQASLTPDEIRRRVFLPPTPANPKGRVVLAGSYESANKFKEMQSAVGSALGAAKRLEPYMKFSTRIPFSKDKAEAEGIITELQGALRLPYTGPGVLTDSEKEQLKAVIGDPTRLTAWIGQEKARLGRLQLELKARLQHEASLHGIREKVVPENLYNVNNKVYTEDELVAINKQKHPGIPEEKIRQLVNKAYSPL